MVRNDKATARGRQRTRRGSVAARRLIAAGALLAALGTGGCQGLGQVRVSDWPPRPVDKVDEIILRLTPPTAMNWDDVPGPDGLQTQVHFFQVDRPLSVTVKGKLEFALYEGRSTAAALADRKPIRVWAFDNGELERHLGKSIIGWGYAMRLGWGSDPPKSSSVTLVTRYCPSEGPAKVSEPLHVAMGPR